MDREAMHPIPLVIGVVDRHQARVERRYRSSSHPAGCERRWRRHRRGRIRDQRPRGHDTIIVRIGVDRVAPIVDGTRCHDTTCRYAHQARVIIQRRLFGRGEFFARCARSAASPRFKRNSPHLCLFHFFVTLSPLPPPPYTHTHTASSPSSNDGDRNKTNSSPSEQSSSRPSRR
jgi:hypothetical protein